MTLALDYIRRSFVAWATWHGITYRLWLRLGLSRAGIPANHIIPE